MRNPSLLPSCLRSRGAHSLHFVQGDRETLQAQSTENLLMSSQSVSRLQEVPAPPGDSLP